MQITEIKSSVINQSTSKNLCYSYFSLKDKYDLFSSASLINTGDYKDFLVGLGYESCVLEKIDLIKHYLLIGQFSHGRKYSLAWDSYRENGDIPWSSLVEKCRGKDLVSIIIPVHGQLEITKECVKSLYENTSGYDYEVILVDNGSDKVTENGLISLTYQYSNVRVIRQAENKNFSLGSNLGFAEAEGEYCVFLNNDTQVTPGWLAPLIARIKKNDVFAAQPLLLYPDGTIQCIGIVFNEKANIGYPIYQGLDVDYCNAQRPRLFQAITGACMAIKSKLFAQVHGFDPIYINGQEDIDLCLRLKLLTRNKAAYVPESKLFHFESKTPGRSKYRLENRYVFYHYWREMVQHDDYYFYEEDMFETVKLFFDTVNNPIIRSVKPSLTIYNRRNQSMDSMLKIKTANTYFKEKRYEEAIEMYKMAAQEIPDLTDYVLFNISLINLELYGDFSYLNSTFFRGSE
ncbi:hypothetical protein BZG82_15950, partial [Salinivibrio sp. PR5]